MIISYWAGRYGHLDTLNSKIHPLFQILDTDPGWGNNSGGGTEEWRRRNGGGAAAVHWTCRMGYFLKDCTHHANIALCCSQYDQKLAAKY